MTLSSAASLPHRAEAVLDEQSHPTKNRSDADCRALGRVPEHDPINGQFIFCWPMQAVVKGQQGATYTDTGIDADVAQPAEASSLKLD